ncbi:MAG TPA: hypothetical protein VJC11_01620 [Patescibacteria group bacterium]|nr:hypothetical protein [Patescibacteria group bacterium]
MGNKKSGPGIIGLLAATGVVATGIHILQNRSRAKFDERSLTNALERSLLIDELTKNPKFGKFLKKKHLSIQQLLERADLDSLKRVASILKNTK